MSGNPVCRHEEIGSHCDCRYWLSLYQDYKPDFLNYREWCFPVEFANGIFA